MSRGARAALLSLALLGAGCGGPEAPAPVASPAPVPAGATVLLDEAELGPLALPAATGRWPLLAVLPAALPPAEAWTSLELEGAGGVRAVYARPATLPASERLELVRDSAGLHLEHRIVPGPDASEAVRLRAAKPVRTVRGVAAVRVRTVAPVAPRAAPRKLRTAVDGGGAGAFRPEELATVASLPDPCRPEHEGGRPLAALVALRVPLDEVVAVRLEPEGSAAPVRVDGALLRSPPDGGTVRIKANRRGEWSFKQLGPPPDCERVQVVKNIDRVDILTR